MKAVMQSLYVLTTAVGSGIDLIAISALREVFDSQVYTKLFF